MQIAEFMTTPASGDDRVEIVAETGIQDGNERGEAMEPQTVEASSLEA